MNLVGLFHMLRVPDRISTTFTRISSQKVSFHEAHWIESAPFRQHCGVACELLGTMLQIEVDGHRMYSEGHKPNDSSSLQPVDANRQYAWKERNYVVPNPSRMGFQWKASALQKLRRLDRSLQPVKPVTVVVPALYNFMPAEVLALGWLNEIDSLTAIRQRIMLVSKLIGWDVFTFHTRHNLDPYFDSAIKAVRETWLNEGALSMDAISQTRKRFGAAFDYHKIEARLVENLLIQTSLMEWLTVRAAARPLQFHVIGTGLLSSLVWSGAIPFQSAIRTAVKLGIRWDAKLGTMAHEDLRRSGSTSTEENLGWRRFHRVRQLVEGRAEVNLTADPSDFPQFDAPTRPFWFSATAKDEPVWIETKKNVRKALESMNLSSWSPDVPKPLAEDRSSGRVRGWLASPMHPVASACHWSFYNYLLATPDASLLFINHIATVAPAGQMTIPQNAPANRASVTYPNAGTAETRPEPGY